ncbi:hypothetical protein ACFVT6_37485 [Streptomyces sp. NPDC058049]|uniref:hypothetical protein n=1 Tax=Streptomyces sp. NPDC058049 TaxID=3346314 RepID=UPI0036EF3549
MTYMATIDPLADYQGRVIELSRIRREAIEEAAASGMSQSEITALLGVSRGRVGQLAPQEPPPERAFFGTDLMTISLGGKYEAGKLPDENPGEVVAREDLGNFDRLRKLLATLKLDAHYEVIPPSGMVNLNRDNHVVVCGHRLSPIIAQVLEGDDYLRFEKDRAWHHDQHGRQVLTYSGDANGELRSQRGRWLTPSAPSWSAPPAAVKPSACRRGGRSRTPQVQALSAGTSSP